MMNTEEAVRRILADVTDRRGWRQAWDGFDEDIKEEIKDTWKSILDDIEPCIYDCSICHEDEDEPLH